MCITRNNRQPRHHVIPPCTLPQLRQNQQCHQKCADHINSNRFLHILTQFKNWCRNPRVLHNGIDPIQVPHLFTESLHTRIAAQIDFPDFDNTLIGLERVLDILLRVEALVQRAAAKNDFGSAQADEVTRCFETEASVCACYYYCLTCEGLGGVGKRRELGFEEGCEEGGWAGGC